jgi:hypothetical protein
VFGLTSGILKEVHINGLLAQLCSIYSIGLYYRDLLFLNLFLDLFHIFLYYNYSFLENITLLAYIIE